MAWSSKSQWKAAPKKKPLPTPKWGKGKDARPNFTQKAIAGYQDYERKQAPAALASEVGGWSQAALASRLGGGGMGGYMPSGGGGGGGGGRGGGGGALDDPYKEYRAQLEAKLNELKAAVPGALQGYANEYAGKIGNIIAQNAPLTQGYSNDIGSILNNVLAQARSAGDQLGNDLSAQGADIRSLGAQQAQNEYTNTAVAGNADAYNRRLAQLQQMQNADRQSMGAAINQSAQGQLENEYLRALMQIQGIR